MWLVLFRSLVVALLSLAGYVYSPFPGHWAGLAVGVTAAGASSLLELRIRNVPGPTWSGPWSGASPASSAPAWCGA